MEYITRKKASMEACKFTPNDVRKINGTPEMCVYTCLKWKDSFCNWVESAYNGKLPTYVSMGCEFNKNLHRQFKKPDGKIINYCRVLEEYLSFMCQQDNNGKGYTVSRFKKFVAENYHEITGGVYNG